MIQKKLSIKLSSIIPLIIIVILAIIFVFPIILMLTTSFKTNKEAFDLSIGLLPKTLHMENYASVFEVMPFWLYVGNSVWVSFMSVLGVVVSTPLIAFSLSKIRWKGRDLIFSIITASMMIPYTVTMIPLYKMWSRIGMVGTFWPLIIPAFFGYPFYIIILRQFMLSIPDELMEAAEIDGCGRWKCYLRIILPLSKPGISTITIFAFMNAFSDFLGPLLYANNMDHFTLSIGLYSFMNEHTVNWTGMMAATTLFMIPIMIIFMFFQRYIIDGISTSGLKG